MFQRHSVSGQISKIHDADTRRGVQSNVKIITIYAEHLRNCRTERKLHQMIEVRDCITERKCEAHLLKYNI